jgi:hypothetical protein
MLYNARPTHYSQIAATPFKSMEKTMKRNPVRIVVTEDKKNKKLYLNFIK